MAKFLKTWAPRLAFVLLLIPLAFSLVTYAWHDWTTVTFPLSLDYGEGPILDQVVRLAHFETIYPADISHAPFSVGNYPPLFHLFQAPFEWIFGPALWYGRAIAALAVAAAAIFIGLTLYNLTGSLLASAAGGLALLAFPYILLWSSADRVDSLALGLSWAALFTITRWPDRRKGIVLGAVLLSAAVYTKQSYGLAAPMAAFFWLLVRPTSPSSITLPWIAKLKINWRAFELAGWTAAICIGLFLLLNLATGGGFFFHIIQANVNPFRWQTVDNYFHEIRDNLILLLILAGCFILSGLWKRGRTSAWRLVLPYCLGATASAITIGKDGSYINYLFEFSAALALVTGASIVWAAKRWYLQTLVVLLLAAQFGLMVAWTQDSYVNRSMDRIKQVKDIQQLALRVKQTQGEVLADEYMSLVVLAGLRLPFQPFEFKMLSEGGIWDQQPFLDSIARKEYALILLYSPGGWDSLNGRWTKEQLSAINTFYQSDGRFADTTVYIPKPANP